MTNYLLSIYQPGGQPAPVDLEAVMTALEALNQEIRDAGSWVFTGGLHDPDTATVLRPGSPTPLMTDGPFIESKEHVGGLYILAVDDLDEATAWASKVCSATGLAVEVRPFQG